MKVDTLYQTRFSRETKPIGQIYDQLTDRQTDT